MGFSRPEHWSGLSFPSPGDLSDSGTESAFGHYQFSQRYWTSRGFPNGSMGKESTCNAGEVGLILRFDPWVGKIPLEKEMITHSSVLAWEIPWIEKLGRLQSTGVTKESNTT